MAIDPFGRQGYIGTRPRRTWDGTSGLLRDEYGREFRDYLDYDYLNRTQADRTMPTFLANERVRLRRTPKNDRMIARHPEWSYDATYHVHHMSPTGTRVFLAEHAASRDAYRFESVSFPHANGWIENITIADLQTSPTVKKTSVVVSTKPAGPTFGELLVGSMFRLANGETVYILSDERKAISLSSGYTTVMAKDAAVVLFEKVSVTVS